MDFKFEFSTLKLGKNKYFCACLNFFVNQCNYYKPFNKTNTIPLYINISSNHPTPIIKQIPNAVNIKINRLSSSKIFNNHQEFIMKPYVIVDIRMNLNT